MICAIKGHGPVGLRLKLDYFEFPVISNSKLFPLDLPFNYLLPAISNSRYFELFLVFPERRNCCVVKFRNPSLKKDQQGWPKSQNKPQRIPPHLAASRCSVSWDVREKWRMKKQGRRSLSQFCFAVFMWFFLTPSPN